MMVLNLIERAIQNTRKRRNEVLSALNAINEPLTPKAKISYRYLTLRESIALGCAETVKIIPNPYKRNMAYSILKSAVETIFMLGKDERLINQYNKLLDELIGMH